MDFLNEASRATPAGDSSTFLTDATKKRKGQTEGFVASDLPGFVNPMVQGAEDKSIYIPEDAAGADQAPMLSRDQAEEMSKKKKTPAEILYPPKE